MCIWLRVFVRMCVYVCYIYGTCACACGRMCVSIAASAAAASICTHCPFSLWVIPGLVVVSSFLCFRNPLYTHTHMHMAVRYSYIQVPFMGCTSAYACDCLYVLRIRRVAHCEPHLNSPQPPASLSVRLHYSYTICSNKSKWNKMKNIYTNKKLQNIYSFMLQTRAAE